MDWLTIAIALMHWANVRLTSMYVRHRTKPADPHRI
jgi:hypothetical protein